MSKWLGFKDSGKNKFEIYNVETISSMNFLEHEKFNIIVIYFLDGGFQSYYTREDCGDKLFNSMSSLFSEFFKIMVFEDESTKDFVS